LIVKLPVKTPTPERKTTIKHRMTPERESPNLSALGPSTASNENLSGSEPTTINGANPTAVDTKENTKQTSNSTMKPTSAPPKSPPRQPQEPPLSPLAFRGSPEKLPAFPPSVEVGFAGN
jgi:hypothetical protein